MKREYNCPGLAMPQPADAPEEGYVACYIAGHRCESETVREEDERGTFSEIRCRCCGELYGSMYVPKGVES